MAADLRGEDQSNEAKRGSPIAQMLLIMAALAHKPRKPDYSKEPKTSTGTCLRRRGRSGLFFLALLLQWKIQAVFKKQKYKGAFPWGLFMNVEASILRSK